MIETSKVLQDNKPIDIGVQFGAYNSKETSSFREVIGDALQRRGQEMNKMHHYDTITSRIEGGAFSLLERNTFETSLTCAEGKKNTKPMSLKKQFQKYKEDQLLSNPGGDYFDLKKGTKGVDCRKDQSQFTVRVGEDIKDAGENFVNIFKDMGAGASFQYVDKDGMIQEGKKVGLGGTMVHFFKDMAGGMTLGKYATDGEERPANALETIKHFFKKIFVDALFKDIVVGVPRSAIHIGENAVFACLNLAEVIPDATIGNYKKGQKVTTEVFDDAQVLVDFVTDIVPMGEAGARTKAITFKKGLKGFPFIYNITSPEHGMVDEQWRYVRNTPFRKTIESVATLIPVRI
ncbi:MAG: hypothetical protein DCC43_08390 [Candidatus Brocadia sp.]|nr:hypothetical protein [Candidatus Brocadia fulgida]MCC6325056.1 hypothetical protein [Candidatus Brocadia sp.]MCE7912126.1 hypothetical protein [Candidatus Brocadia sp. AMX3]MDG5996599.1 hypothetical protein [Candidatus Brocadia sp.]RIJ99448.1 MAG: hypothetical protein DCC43_08390 [Candidatus Brocadia sp.]